MSSRSLDTELVYLGCRPEPQYGAVCPPIFQTSTFAQDAPGEYGDYDYTRTDNPTRTLLQQMFAAAEGAKYGLAFASGMAAIDCVFSLLKAGDHVVTGMDIYGGTYRYLHDVAARRGITFTQAPMDDEAALRAALKPETRLIWFESPTNPLLNLVDIAMVVQIAKDHGCYTAIDNTFMSPYFQRPLALGVDFVMHSVTKYLNGHSDVVMGAVMTNLDAEYTDLKSMQNAIGPTPGPWDCYLTIRGMKTLAVRMRQHEIGAKAVAEFLAGHPKIRRAIYPGLAAHPHHELAKRQMSGFGGMVSFELDSDLEGTKRFLCGTQLFTLAVSLGGVESLVQQPAAMTHFEVPKAEREAVGITDSLVRASIGIEDPQDLIDDLAQALERV